jgi:hypothetical protein
MSALTKLVVKLEQVEKKAEKAVAALVSLPKKPVASKIRKRNCNCL